MKKILVINGPNLNLLGKRNHKIYGKLSLDNIIKHMKDKAKSLEFELCFYQSNHEGNIIDKLQQSSIDYDCIIINPGALTHYSIGIRDCIESIKIPVIEVHISNIFDREDFRSRSVIAPVSSGHISGFGYKGYIIALEAAKNIMEGYDGTS